VTRRGSRGKADASRARVDAGDPVRVVGNSETIAGVSEDQSKFAKTSTTGDPVVPRVRVEESFFGYGGDVQ